MEEKSWTDRVRREILTYRNTLDRDEFEHQLKGLIESFEAYVVEDQCGIDDLIDELVQVEEDLETVRQTVMRGLSIVHIEGMAISTEEASEALAAEMDEINVRLADLEKSRDVLKALIVWSKTFLEGHNHESSSNH